jgi:transposase-like protein
VSTSADDPVVTDALGRRTGPRRAHSLEEKRRIVEETHVKGASVSSVARRHDVNPNQVFAWRQLYRKGVLDPKAVAQQTEMLPVRVSTPTVLPIKPAAQAGKAVGPQRPSKQIEIKLANGHSVVLRGRVDELDAVFADTTRLAQSIGDAQRDLLQSFNQDIVVESAMKLWLLRHRTLGAFAQGNRRSMSVHR